MLGRMVTMGVCWLPLVALAGQPDLERASQLSAEMKYPQALKLVNKVLRSADSGPGDFAQAYAIQGRCLAATGKDRKATRAFRRLLAIQPDYELPASVSPKFRPPFDRARKLAAKQGVLRLAHTPPDPGADLGGVVLSVTLQANPLRMASAVRLVYSSPGGKPARAQRSARAGKALKFRLPKKLAATELHYHFEAVNRTKGVLVRSTSMQNPHVIKAAAPVVAAAGGAGDGGEVKPGPEPAVGTGPEAGTDPPSDASGTGDGSASVVRRPETDLDGAAAAAGADPMVGAGGEPAESGQDEDGTGPAWYQTWWFWTSVGVVVAGGVAAGVAVGLAGDDGGPIRYDVTLR